MWHGPFGLYGWIHDEEADGPRRHLVNMQVSVRGLPRALICRRLGHRPIVDGYGAAAGDPGKPWREAKRWVACGRCDTRPTWPGDLPPALFPTLGAPYVGQWVSGDDARAASKATDAARQRYYAEQRAALDDGSGNVPTVDPPQDLMPAWPSLEWGHDVEDRPGPRGAVSAQILVWQGKRSDFPGYGFGFSLGAGERPIKFHVHGGKLGSLYVGFEDYGRSFAHRILGRDLPTTRVFEFDVEPARATVRWQIAARRHEWRSSDPKWMDGHVNFADLLLGRTVVDAHEIDHRDVMIPLPEGRYPARVTLRRSLRRRPRLPRVTTTYGYDLEPACGVPVPGKGENSYDCDDDAHYSQSGPCSGPEYGSEWVTEAVSGFVSGVLRQRQRYGSGLEWKPSAGWPAEMLPA